MSKPAKKQQSAPPPKGDGKLSSFLKCTTRRVHRSQIHAADYNPRQIDDWARQKLKSEIKKHGLVNKLVWNEKTGNLVSGHQRLSILDELEGGTDYELEVDCVSMAPKAEKHMNVFLNNKSTQGAWDLEKLAELIKDPDLDYEAMGFDRIELETEFADLGLLDSMFTLEDQEEEVQESVAELEEMAEKNGTLESGEAIKDPERHAEVIEERNRMREKMKAVNDAADSEFYTIVVFGSREEREHFMKGLGKVADEKYLDGRELMHRLNIPLPTTEQA